MLSFSHWPPAGCGLQNTFFGTKCCKPCMHYRERSKKTCMALPQVSYVGIRSVWPQPYIKGEFQSKLIVVWSLTDQMFFVFFYPQKHYYPFWQQPCTVSGSNGAFANLVVSIALKSTFSTHIAS